MTSATVVNGSDRRHARARAASIGLGVALAACASAPPGSAIEPRFVAIHNALAAMGLAQVGPMQQGSLAEGREARLPIELGAQCATLVALGGEGVRDLDATLVDPTGKAIAHDVTRDAQAVVRACVEAPGTYTLVLKMQRGAGDFVTAAWSGGARDDGAAAADAAARAAAGTCEAPIPLVAGTYNGSTARGESDNEGSCANSVSRELVYRLEIATRQRVTIEVDPHFDAVLYVRRDDCTDADGEVTCNDDTPHGHSSRIDEVLDPGTYFVFVDGYNNEIGAFKMNVALSEVPTLAEACQKARPLALGSPKTGSTHASYDHAGASCGDGAKGPDTIYQVELAQRSRVRVLVHSDDFPPVVHLRRQCADDRSEVGCADAGANDGDVAFIGVLDPGRYAVFADASDHAADGSFTATLETDREQGGGVSGDACGDAQPLPPSEALVSGDTFSARDDVSGRCGGAGGADLVYRVDVPHRSRFTSSFTGEEGKHVFVLSRSCGDRAGEIACGDAIDEVIAPGTYYLAVDSDASGFGRFDFEWHTRDIAGQEAACRGTPVLRSGVAVTGSTAGATDKFSSSCAGRSDAQTSSDRVYQIVLARRTRVTIALATPSWDGVLVLRRSCLDGSASRAGAEIECNNDADDIHHARIDTVLEAGTYYVVVDGHASNNDGPFTLEYRAL